jgi:WhiB family transcriptional regulator, redox-sensing transcriptional regulator
VGAVVTTAQWAGRIARAADHLDWRHRAACRGVDPELFFPIGTVGPAALQIEQAKQVCQQCCVRAHCLAWALQSEQEFGIWGGTSEDERLALLSRA